MNLNNWLTIIWSGLSIASKEGLVIYCITWRAAPCPCVRACTQGTYSSMLFILGYDVCLVFAAGSLGHIFQGAPIHSVSVTGSGAEIYAVPPGIPSRAPLVNFGSPACCQALTTILTLVFNNSMQVVFHQLLFWFGSYGRNVSGFLAGISRAGDLLLLCNVTFQSVLGMKIMECHLLSLLNFKGMHLLCGRNIWGET